MERLTLNSKIETKRMLFYFDDTTRDEILDLFNFLKTNINYPKYRKRPDLLKLLNDIQLVKIKPASIIGTPITAKLYWVSQE